MPKLSTARLKKAERLSQARTGMHSQSVYGVVDKLIDGEQHIVRRWKGTIGNMVETDEEPNIFLCEALEPEPLDDTSPTTISMANIDLVPARPP